MKPNKSKKKELRRKYENLVGQRFVEGLKKESTLSLSELVDLKVYYEQL